MNIDADILNKVLANQRSYTMTKWESTQIHKDGSTYAHQSM